MLKRLLVVGSIFLLLVVGFALVPVPVAHADTCSGSAWCGQDPYTSGCANGPEDVIAAQEFTYGSSHWLIREMSSSKCNTIWASLILLSGNNGIYNAKDIKVEVINNHGVEYDILSSNRFYNGAYTNMIDAKVLACVYYDGAYVTPRVPSACFY